jgi:eukaryotic-like serine/threonine-protein kinase
MEKTTPTLSPGDMVGRYKVLRSIGVGAMGEVFLGVDDSLGRRAAIKLLGLKHLENETVRERFLREARALARLSHPNLITVYESGHIGENNRPYFAMELLEGGDVEKLLLERGPLPPGVVALIGAQAAAGLGEAARAQIIHRDVKPANLGISGQGVLKVTDFSLAKSHTIERNLTAKGFVVGTADYIAPEQARGEALDERADVYSLGCSLYHLLTGRPPYRATGTEVQRYVEIMQSHVSAPVQDPRSAGVGPVDDELAQLVMSCMDKDRERRPTFEELAPALMRVHKRVGGGLPRLTRPIFSLPMGVAVASGPTEELEIPSPSVDQLPRRRAPVAVLTAVVAVVVLGLIWLATRQ